MKDQLNLQNFKSTVNDFNLRESRSQDELSKYGLRGSTLPKISGATTSKNSTTSEIDYYFKHKQRKEDYLNRYDVKTNRNNINIQIPKKNLYTINYNSKEYVEPGFPQFDYNGKRSMASKINATSRAE